jgi:hypothetical protein
MDFCLAAHYGTEVKGVGEGIHLWVAESGQTTILQLRQVIWGNKDGKWKQNFHAHLRPLTPAQPAHETDIQYQLLGGMNFDWPIDFALAPLENPEILQLVLQFHGRWNLLKGVRQRVPLLQVAVRMHEYYDAEKKAGNVPEFAQGPVLLAE